MRRFLIAILIAGICPLWAATYFAQVGPSGQIKRVVVIRDSQASNEPAANAFKSNLAVSLIGDSIIANMAVAQPSLPTPFTSAQNLGVIGNTVAQIQARLSGISASVTHVVLEGGTNDLVALGTDANIIPGYKAILTALTPLHHVILMGIPQVDEAQLSISNPGFITFLNNALIATENAKLVTLCNSFPKCVPATDFMAMSLVGQTTDGVHPVTAEYAPIAANLLKAF